MPRALTATRACPGHSDAFGTSSKRVWLAAATKATAMGVFNFKEQFVAYAQCGCAGACPPLAGSGLTAYPPLQATSSPRPDHNNSVNAGIHIVFVPAIMWTVMVWLSDTPPVLGGLLPAALARVPGVGGALASTATSRLLPLLPAPVVRVEVARVVAAAMGTYYTILDPIFGVSALPALALG